MTSSHIDQISTLGSLPLAIDNTIANTIIKDVIKEMAEKLRWVQTMVLEEPLPTMSRPDSRKELANYIVNTDPLDFPLLEDRQYVTKYHKGLYPPVVSPFWLNLLAVPDLFHEVQLRFLRLYQKLPDAP